MSKCGSNKPSGEYPVLPVDVVINIMSRLPMKSMAQCRCVSKLWSSVIRRTNNNLLFPITFPDPPPRILLTIEYAGDLFFYTSPHNPDVNLSLVATFHHKTSGKDLYECSSEYHVLTIGTENENLLWREIQCCTTLYPLNLNESGICIDGVIYYPSEMEKGKPTIVCFDVRSEKFFLVSVETWQQG
ncbi:PREDICTED: putative F-box protein At1g53550 [Camelina sativa]|uniref:F-box protein At1g53550 n=1 Tax=Camelina sativa TaxID=90675 RepID=A0ABM0X5T2_CAMSA|nr:PREDICTED: putative F-box protein At1g53550 [Camelina sativa]